MVLLADLITVAPRFARSANLERDAAALEPLEGYVVTARALDVVERIASTAADRGAGGAWSLTGPYGSGKSSLGLLLDAAFGPSGLARTTAYELISGVSAPVGQLVRKAHRRHDTSRHGFHRGLVTARREALSRTVLRALHSAASRSFGSSPSPQQFAAADALDAALHDADSGDPRIVGPSPSALVEIARSLAEDRPLLLILDEFGKNLEAAGDGADSDPYLLQQLAEAGQGSGLPIFLLTLQHLSFEDHLSGTDAPQRREWAKVQGRFEDVAYAESAAQTRALIGTAFDVRDEALRGRIARWATRAAAEISGLGVAELADPATVAECYPLHPLTALVLPELCNRYGQHERTLFSFLTGTDTASAASFLRTAELRDREPLPSLGLDAVYDYFVAGGSSVVAAPGRSSRWIEIATRLRDTHGLTDAQARMAKSAAVLNLVSATGTVRASRPLLLCTGRDSPTVLDELEAAGILTYRRFADEYRAWQGTDVDIRHLLDRAGEHVDKTPLVDLLSNIDRLSPQVAARHSAEFDTLRVFSRRYVDGIESVEPPDAFSPYDGEVLLVVGERQVLPCLIGSNAGKAGGVEDGFKPVVAAVPANVSALRTAAREVATVAMALDDPSVTKDWVARRELGERLAQARASLESARTATFTTSSCRWILLDNDSGQDLPSGRGSAALSAATDVAYRSTPLIRNEMLNRTHLTSQGAKARRELLSAMIEHESEQDLGLTGFGPEVAMYRAFLARTGLHAPDSDGNIRFGEPADALLQPAWRALESQFGRSKRRRINLNDVFATLRSPPIGMKSGAVPVFVTAGLLARTDDVALYEHGTFRPLLTPEVSERMVKNPDHFDVKAFANTRGARRVVIEALAERLGVRALRGRPRVANVVAVVGHLVSRARRLDNYTRRTERLPEAIRGVREALLSATEPDELLFSMLPSILGFEDVRPDAETYSDAESFAMAIGDAVAELEQCLGNLLEELRDLLLNASGETSRGAVYGLATVIDGKVLDSEVRAFVGALANDGADTDAAWISSIATVVARKAPAEWTDNDRERFCQELPQRLAAFGRLVAMYAQRKADGGGPFDALRVTVTRPDGSEYDRLVGIDHRSRHDVESILSRALDELAGVTGSTQRAGHALLALLGEQLLTESSAAGGTIGRIDIPEETRQGPEARSRYG